MKKFFKRVFAQILLWLDGVSSNTLQKILNILDVFKKVIQSPGLDIIVQLTNTQTDNVILDTIRYNIEEFAKQFSVSADAFNQCKQIASADKRVLCYLKTIVELTGKTPGEVLRDLFLFIGDKLSLNVLPSHLELLHETTK